jgi:hypothetical protein
VGKKNARKTPCERARPKWEGVIKLDPKEAGRANVDWIDLAEFCVKCWAAVNAVMQFRAP